MHLLLQCRRCLRRRAARHLANGEGGLLRTMLSSAFFSQSSGIPPASIQSVDLPILEERDFSPTVDIRLLRLIHRKPGEYITARLEAFRLGSPICPPFTTLSYVWDAPVYAKSIVIDGRNVPILDNLYPILERFSASEEFKEDRWIWIDSICINQANTEERAIQVQLMGKIFAKSARTVVWLGDADPKVVDDAVHFIDSLATNASWLHQQHIIHGVRRTPAYLRCPGKWKAVETFLRAPWWNRMWTLQECVIAKRVDFYFGGRSVPHRKLGLALSAIWACEPDISLMTQTAWTAAWNRLRLRQWYHRPGYSENLGLIALMAYSGANHATDPRDRIYALLGLAAEGCRAMVGQPTYDDDIQQIYTRLVESFTKRYNNIDIICFSQLFRHASHKAPAGSKSPAKKWPSWLPDWRTVVQPFVVPLMVSQSLSYIGNFRPPSLWPSAADVDLCSWPYHADVRHRLDSPGLNAQFKDGQMMCDGICLDIIDGLGALQDHNLSPESDHVVLASSKCNTTTRESVDQPPSESRHLLHQLVASLTLDRKDRYLSIPAPTRQYVDEMLHLVSFPLVSSKTLPERCQLALRWYHANKHFVWRGRTLEQLCRNATDPSAEPKPLSSREDGFASRLIDTTGVMTMKRRLLVSKNGHIGMAPPEAQKGDLLFVLTGCSVPVVLRKQKSSYSFVGEAFVYGFMNGEAAGKSVKQTTLTLV
jgi:hypothetical protein